MSFKEWSAAQNDSAKGKPAEKAVAGPVVRPAATTDAPAGKAPAAAPASKG